MLKNIVDNTKYSLNAISAFTYTLDPTLGESKAFVAYSSMHAHAVVAVVWLVKCIIDAILDTLENVTDGIINDGLMAEMQEMMQEMLVQANDASCILGFLCL